MEFGRNIKENRENSIRNIEIPVIKTKSKTSNSKKSLRSYNNMKSNESRQLPMFKIKTSAFGEYLNLGTLPQSFTKLIKMISIQVYPKNFSLNYLSLDFETLAIDSRATYKNLYRKCFEENSAELKLFVIIHENNHQGSLTEEFGNLRISTDSNSHSRSILNSSADSRKSSVEDSSTDYSLSANQATFTQEENVNKREVAMKHSRLSSKCIHCY